MSVGNKPLSGAVEAFGRVLSSDGLIADHSAIQRGYGRNVTALRRDIPLVLRPRDETEVRGIVTVANELRIPLYPFSTGKNWGLGSKLPVVDGCAVVDLSRMDRIVEVSEEFEYAIIEPGVTQGALAAHLNEHFPEMTMNFTGSFSGTSVLGNVLERGDGAYARVHDLLGVRGVLGNGEDFEAGGFWTFVGGEHPSHCSRYTAGPDLAGMFAQSSFGITTQMAFRLIARPESRYLVWGTAPADALERLVDTFDYYGRQGVINRGSVNIGYENRFVQAAKSLADGDASKAAETSWNFYVLIMGTRRVMQALSAELCEAFEPFCSKVNALDVGKGLAGVDLPPFLQPLIKPLMGSPDSESIKMIYALTGTALPSDARELDVDFTPFGMKCYIPVIPPRGPYVRRAADIVAASTREHDLNVKLSVFGDGRALVTIHFRADDAAQVARAEACERYLWDEMVAAGFPPYRVSIDQMQRLVDLHPRSFELVSQLKSVLDPNGIIAPGRYCRLG